MDWDAQLRAFQAAAAKRRGAIRKENLARRKALGIEPAGGAKVPQRKPKPKVAHVLRAKSLQDVKTALKIVDTKLLDWEARFWLALFEEEDKHNG